MPVNGTAAVATSSETVGFSPLGRAREQARAIRMVGRPTGERGWSRSFEEAARPLQSTPRAVRVNFRRYGFERIRLSVLRARSYPKETVN